MRQKKIKETPETKAARLMWAAKFPRCWNCGRKNTWPPIAVHHILGAALRSDEPCNWAILCGSCHAAVHGERPVVDGKALEKIGFETILKLKRKFDPGNWNPERLAELRGHALPEIEDDKA